MRKFFILASLLSGVVMFSGSPARSDVGCGCVRFGAPAVCTATIMECNAKIGGLCLAPCNYQAPKRARHSKKHKDKEA
jgi:hypothetical protein